MAGPSFRKGNKNLPIKEQITEWIKFQKSKWEFQQRQKENKVKRLRTGESAEVATRGRVVREKPSTTMGGFLKRAQRTLLDVPWQVIQIAETGTPGLFRLWALVGQDLHLIKLVVPRIFFVNQRHPKAESEDSTVWRKVTKALPRSHPSHYLYEYSIPEEAFREHSNELMADLSTPDIEGIYETQVPLEFRALVQLGCVCVVDRAIVHTETDTFELGHLKFKTVAQYKYLEPESLRHIYFYHHKSGTKSMYGIFLPSSKKGHTFVVDTVRSNQMPNMNILYNKERGAKIKRGTAESNLPEANYSFEIKFETDLRQAYRQMQRVLQNYREEKRGPTYVALQSLHDFPTMTSYMPLLVEFPLIPIHVTDIDTLYNVLDWQRVGAKTMIRHFLGLPVLLDTTFELARYFHVPVGNIPRDTTAFGGDLFYARHLQKHNTVLWCSPSTRPDLGGREFDDNRLVAELEETNFVTEINNSGCYSTVCIELDIDALAVNTLLQTPAINELEGTSSSIAFDAVPQSSLQDMIGGAESNLTTYDETARCAHSFKILRHMVAAWLRDVSLYQNVFADFQIVHFYRWLRDPSSLLYDPALRKILNTHMQKLFLHLISEFKRLGSAIVYANFNKIVICTKKKRIEDAIAYVQYIVDTIHNKELFHSIDITFSQCWEHLMWLDLANHGGVKGTLPTNSSSQIKPSTNNDDDSDEEEQQNQSEDILSEERPDNEPVIIEMNWNMAEFLDDVGQTSFNDVISTYINIVWEKSQECNTRFTPGNTPMKRKSGSQSQSKQSADSVENTVKFSQELIAGDLSQKLFNLTQSIHKLGGSIAIEDREDESDFNISRLISTCKYDTPALRFVKSICKVLSLEQAVSEQVTKLRRDLLKLLNMGEFSADSLWKDPCVTFILPEVICRACNHCRNIDLCKDPNQRMESGTRVWFCSSCSTTYCSKEIENMLVTLAQTRSMAYVLQDLQCNRCAEIKQPNMSLYCPCGGRFKTLLKRDEFKQKMKIMLMIAKVYKLEMLRETVEWIRSQNPWLSS